MDIHSKNVRSFNMSRIKNKNTKPEILIRKICHKLGLRFRINQKLFNTRPDIIFKKHKYVIFVNGCFWHKHTCKYGKVIPKTNTEFWEQKRLKTKERDKRNYFEILQNDWNYAVIWECELKDLDKLENKLKKTFKIY